MLSKIKNLIVTINYGKQSKASWYYIVNFFCSSTTSLPDWVLLGDETHMANLLGRKRESTIYDWAQLFNEPSKSLCRSPKRQSDLFSPNTPQPLRFGQYYALYMVHSAATCLLLQFVVFEVLVQGSTVRLSIVLNPVFSNDMKIAQILLLLQSLIIKHVNFSLEITFGTTISTF